MIHSLLLFSCLVSDDPVKRMLSYVNQSPNMRVEYEVNVNGQLADVSYAWRYPHYQKLEILTAEIKSRYMQSPDLTLVADHGAKLYWELTPPQGLWPVSSDFPALARCFPYLFLSIAIAKDHPERFKTIDPSNLDYIDPDGTIMHVKVDGVGRPLSMTYEIGTQHKEAYKYTFKSFDHTWFSVESEEWTLPWGYMPGEIPIRRNPRIAGSEAPVGIWQDARTNRPSSLTRKYGKKNYVILFTAPECEISQKAEKAFVQLQTELAKYKVDLIEVSLGKDEPILKGKSSSRQIYWDKTGEIEAAYRPNVTPYLFAVEDGMIAQSFSGWNPAATDQMVAALTAPYKD